MFNRDALFGKKEEPTNNEPRSVNVTPSLGSSPTTMRPQAEPPKTDLRFAEPPRAPAARPDEPRGSRLTVGPDIKLKGVEISNCDTLVVEGRVEASMDSRVVEIAESGVFSGTVSIDVAEIRGRFEGELTARKQLVIYSTGRVSGKIRYGKIRIEEGGELTGDVTTLASATAPVQQPQPQVQQQTQTQQPVQPQASTQPPQAQAAQPKAATPAAQQQAQPQPQPVPQKQATVAAASNAEKPRYEPVPRGGKPNGKGAIPS